MTNNNSYTIYNLGESAITIDFGNKIDEEINRKVIALFHRFRQEPFTGMTEVVPAYSSLTLYFDPCIARKNMGADFSLYSYIKERVEKLLLQPLLSKEQEERNITIPVCYEAPFSPDLAKLAFHNKLTPEEVIAIHTAGTYRVYMLGFLPGFSYMGIIDERISFPRKPEPVPVVAGSVGIAGRQTGVYPFASPGGWSIIGRTPLRMFDIAKDQSALLHAGDKVKFISISKNEFANY